MLNHNRLTRLIKIAALAALSYLLMLFAIPIIPITPDLKLDLSDLPILFGTVLLGPLSGIGIATLKIVLFIILTGFSVPSLMGGLLSWLASVVILLSVSGLSELLNNHPSRWRQFGLVGIETFNLTVVMLVANLFLMPVYFNLVGIRTRFPIAKLLALGIGPFNVIKGVIVGVIFLWLQKRMARHR